MPANEKNIVTLLHEDFITISAIYDIAIETEIVCERKIIF